MTKPAVEDRFVALLEEHKRILYKVASSYCRNPADRQDLTQEMAVALWKSFPRYDSRYRFSTWMYRIALNVAISFYRSEVRRTRRTVPAGDSLLELAAAPESAGPEEDSSFLQDLMRQLDELDRALLLLYLDENSHATIAEILGISETNVGTKIGRIKQRLRALARAV